MVWAVWRPVCHALSPRAHGFCIIWAGRRAGELWVWRPGSVCSACSLALLHDPLCVVRWFRWSKMTFLLGFPVMLPPRLSNELILQTLSLPGHGSSPKTLCCWAFPTPYRYFPRFDWYLLHYRHSRWCLVSRPLSKQHANAHHVTPKVPPLKHSAPIKTLKSHQVCVLPFGFASRDPYVPVPRRIKIHPPDHYP